MRHINLKMDGNQICATWDNFDCLVVSPAGFGDLIGEAVTDLIKNTPAYEQNGITTSIEQAAEADRGKRLSFPVPASPAPAVEPRWANVSEYIACRRALQEGGLMRDITDQDIWDASREHDSGQAPGKGA